MHIFGLRAVTVIPSRQLSSLLLGWLHLAGNLQRGSQAGGGHALHTGAQAGFGGQAGAHAGGGQTGLQAGAQAGLQAGGGQTGLQAGGWQTGLQGCGGHAGLAIGAHGCSHTGAASVSQHVLEQPTQNSAVVHKKSNEANIPSCFLINDSLRFVY
jgi:hypothetical protein